jgi:8-oxo-dGTP diphosphatase
MDPFGTHFDWSAWSATEKAVLCFVFDGARVLLIEKQRGLGAGKVNAPGGRIEPGESPVEAAVRETLEEVLVTPVDPVEIGELRFRFTNGYHLQAQVFRAEAFTGIPTVTPEAIPFWAEVSSLPYHRMWSDDSLWLPYLLRSEPFLGRFVFDGEVMLEGLVEPLGRTS